MKTGDLVRFAKWDDIVDIDDWTTTPKKNIGLLIKYDKLMRIATILYKGEIQSHRAQLVEKSGKKDYEESKDR